MQTCAEAQVMCMTGFGGGKEDQKRAEKSKGWISPINLLANEAELLSVGPRSALAVSRG